MSWAAFDLGSDMMKEVFMVPGYARLHGETGDRKASYKIIFKENKNEQMKPWTKVFMTGIEM